MHRALSLLALLLATPASAAFIQYDNRAVWEAATPGFVVDDLESYPTPSEPPTAEVPRGGLHVVLDDFDFLTPQHGHPQGLREQYPNSDNTILLGELWGDSDDRTETYSWHQPRWNGIDFHEPTYAMSFDALYIEHGCPRTPDDADPFPCFQLAVFILGERFLIDEGFFGITSTEPFQAVTLAIGFGDRMFYYVDNVGHSAATAVPEPSSALLMAVGLFLLSRRTSRPMLAPAERSSA